MRHLNLNTPNQLRIECLSWWCHQMDTFSALLTVNEGNPSPVDSPHKGQWRETLTFSWSASEASNRDAGELNRRLAHYDVTVMYKIIIYGHKYSSTSNDTFMIYYVVFLTHWGRDHADGCHFPDDRFKCISLNENIWISFYTSLKFVQINDRFR